jgi:hypothetical protein
MDGQTKRDIWFIAPSTLMAAPVIASVETPHELLTRSLFIVSESALSPLIMTLSVPELGFCRRMSAAEIPAPISTTASLASNVTLPSPRLNVRLKCVAR